MTATPKPKIEPTPAGIDAEIEAPEPPFLDGLAKQRAAAMDTLKPNCGNCQCGYFPLPDPESWGECRFEPPRMQIIATPPKIAGHGPVYQPLSAWPPVQRVQFCVTGFMVKSTVTQ